MCSAEHYSVERWLSIAGSARRMRRTGTRPRVMRRPPILRRWSNTSRPELGVVTVAAKGPPKRRRLARRDCGFASRTFLRRVTAPACSTSRGARSTTHVALREAPSGAASRFEYSSHRRRERRGDTFATEGSVRCLGYGGFQPEMREDEWRACRQPRRERSRRSSSRRLKGPCKPTRPWSTARIAPRTWSPQPSSAGLC